MEATYLIPGCNLDQLTLKLEDLNKRARRIGAEPITMEVELSHIQRSAYPEGRDDGPWWFGTADQSPEEVAASRPSCPELLWTDHVREWLNVTVAGETPCYEGWSLIAVLEPLVTEDGAENIIQAVPGHECPSVYRDRVGQCDHCNTNRRRNQTFVVRHENGEHRMVGRQCLKDFLGHSNPHSLASMAELLASLDVMFTSAQDEEWMGGGRAASSWTLDSFLQWTSSSIRQTGWTSGKEAFEHYTQSTKSHVLYLVTPPARESSEWQSDVKKFAPNESDCNRASRAMEWALDIDREDEDLSDYLYNVNLIARAGYTNLKTAGVAASIIYAYSRWEEREIERRRAASRLNEHIGIPKVRQEFTVDVVGIYEKQGDFGTTGIHRMYDEEGRSLTWFASGSATWLEVGERYRIKATVRSHGEYRAIRQTNVNRVKVLEALGDSPEVEVTLETVTPAPETSRDDEVLEAPVSLGDV